MTGTQEGVAPLLAERLPSHEEILGLARRALAIPDGTALSITEVSAHTNVNFVFHISGPQLSLFAKAATTRLKSFALEAPRSRVLREAQGARAFGALCGSFVDVPRVIEVDASAFVVLLEDVGHGRAVLIDLLDHDYRGVPGDAVTWGNALGTLARCTRVSAATSEEDRPLGYATWLTIMSHGARQLFPEALRAILQPMSQRVECLVHTDLWGKNILAGNGQRPALLDFENSGLGDPVIDVSSLLTTYLVPALRDVRKAPSYAQFAHDFSEVYARAAGDRVWAEDVLRRAYHAVSVNVAHRAVGLAPYAMTSDVRARAIDVAKRVFEAAPRSSTEFVSALALH